MAGNLDVNLRGFYTEECRQNGVRAGFDIVRIHPNEGIRLADASVDVEVRAGNFLTSVSARAPLARVESKGSGPMVGKYVVDVPSIKTNAIPSIDPSIQVNDSTKCSGQDVVTLVLLDEVGKMEMHWKLYTNVSGLKTALCWEHFRRRGTDMSSKQSKTFAPDPR